MDITIKNEAELHFWQAVKAGLINILQDMPEEKVIDRAGHELLLEKINVEIDCYSTNKD